MKKRCLNVIDDLINKDTDHNKLILDMACIFFDFGKELFGNEYFNILKEYLINNKDIAENMGKKSRELAENKFDVNKINNIIINKLI